MQRLVDTTKDWTPEYLKMVEEFGKRSEKAGTILADTFRRILNAEEKCLIYIVSQVYGLGWNKKTAKRISSLVFQGRPSKRMYVLDFGKPTETTLLEWEIVYPELNPHSQEDYIPYLKTKSLIPIDDFLNQISDQPS
jgi:hypothetical protein